MNCPNCGTGCRNSDFFCRKCGTAFSHADTPKQGSLLVPAVILVAMALCGLIAFFASTSPVSPAPVKSNTDTSYFSTSQELSFFSAVSSFEAT